MIKILNYNCGNIHAIKNAFNRLNIKCGLINTIEDFDDTTKIILPGVGSYDSVINKMNNSGLRNELENKVLINKIPILGICVGMQILGKKSDEGKKEGLGWLDFNIIKIKQNDKLSPLPHMGWNNIEYNEESLFFNKKSTTEYFYFLHSFSLKQTNQSNIIPSFFHYNDKYIGIVEYNNIFGIQFHPEKSHTAGLNILKKFSDI